MCHFDSCLISTHDGIDVFRRRFLRRFCCDVSAHTVWLFTERKKYGLFGIGGLELFIILLFSFLIFGPDKLPEIAKTLGTALRKFKQAQAEMESVIKGEVLDVDDSQNKKSTQATGNRKAAPVTTQESFAQRKARYDKQRAEQKEREAIEANRAAMKQEAAKKAQRQRHATGSGSSDAGGAQGASKPAPTAQKPAPTSASKGSVSKNCAGASVSSANSRVSGTPSASSAAVSTQLTPEELFGTKPISRTQVQSSSPSVSAFHAEEDAAVERGE